MPAIQGVDSMLRNYTSLLRITGAEAGVCHVSHRPS
jgi:hypothetical protein